MKHFYNFGLVYGQGRIGSKFFTGPMMRRGAHGVTRGEQRLGHPQITCTLHYTTQWHVCSESYV